MTNKKLFKLAKECELFVWSKNGYLYDPNEDDNIDDKKQEILNLTRKERKENIEWWKENDPWVFD